MISAHMEISKISLNPNGLVLNAVFKTAVENMRQFHWLNNFVTECSLQLLFMTPDKNMKLQLLNAVLQSFFMIASKDVRYFHWLTG